MDTSERVVRVWRGLDSLQAHFLRQALLETGIECYLDRDARHVELGMNDVGLWVAARDESRAREIITSCEAEMHAALEAETEAGELDE